MFERSLKCIPEVMRKSQVKLHCSGNVAIAYILEELSSWYWLWHFFHLDSGCYRRNLIDAFNTYTCISLRRFSSQTIQCWFSFWKANVICVFHNFQTHRRHLNAWTSLCSSVKFYSLIYLTSIFNSRVIIFNLHSFFIKFQ